MNISTMSTYQSKIMFSMKEVKKKTYLKLSLEIKLPMWY